MINNDISTMYALKKYYYIACQSNGAENEWLILQAATLQSQYCNQKSELDNVTLLFQTHFPSDQDTGTFPLIRV